MLSTQERVKSLENYLAMGKINADPVIDRTINKLLTREYQRVAESKNRLTQDINQFEKQYEMNSQVFQQQYDSGQLTDDMDFMEWSASLDMLAQVEKQLKWLEIVIEK
jgi:hypothetical protein